MTSVHINSTSQVPCNCGCWLQHWRNFSVLPLPVHCPAAACREKPDVGVVVQRSDVNGADWYVVPLCKRHGESTLAVEISSFTMFVPADVKKTCDRDH